MPAVPEHFNKDFVGALQITEFLSATAGGSVAAPHDYGLVASIDGCKCCLSPP